MTPTPTDPSPASPRREDAHERLRTPDSLHDMYDLAWESLIRGVADRRHGFRTPVLATLSPDGLPEARTVVLRHADKQHAWIACHTDARSPKRRSIDQHHHAAWVFYDRSRRIQVRITGPTEILAPDAAERASAAWNNSNDSQRACYSQPHPPSSRIAEHEVAAAARPSPDVPGIGRETFRLLTTRVTRLDCLLLNAAGHRRACFDLDSSGSAVGHWLAP